MNDSFNPTYDDNKVDGRIYFSKKHINEDGDNYRKAEVICEQGNTYTTLNHDNIGKTVEFNVKEKIKLYESPTGQQKYWCWLVESEDGNLTSGLHICRRTSKGNVYNNQEVTLNPHAISVLKTFLEEIKLCNNDMPYKIQTTYKENFNNVITQKEFSQIIEANINDIDDYYRLLDIKKKMKAISELESIIKGIYKNEVSIQKFLKQNIWLFGNEYCEFVTDEKINAKNILDGIPKNLESFIDVIEVKLPNVVMFQFDTNHNNYYSSADLTKAIAQTQNYIFELEKMTVDNKYQEDNECKIIKPRGIVLIGSKDILNNEEIKYLRILNSSYHNIQVITYQQLLAKAKKLLDISNGGSKND